MLPVSHRDNQSLFSGNFVSSFFCRARNTRTSRSGITLLLNSYSFCSSCFHLGVFFFLWNISQAVALFWGFLVWHRDIEPWSGYLAIDWLQMHVSFKLPNQQTLARLNISTVLEAYMLSAFSRRPMDSRVIIFKYPRVQLWTSAEGHKSRFCTFELFG